MKNVLNLKKHSLLYGRKNHPIIKKMAPKIFLIAEIAQAHDGSLGIAHSFIDALSKTGVDAIKFQTHLAEAESSIHEPFRVKFSYQDQTRYDYWKRMEFTESQWIGLKNHCDDFNLEFISSPFSNQAVDLLERIGVKRYKVGSGEASNFLLLQRLLTTQKPIIISSGMSDLNEIQDSIDFVKSSQNDVSLLHCTTSYPTKPGQWQLKSIPQLKNIFDVKVGYSDHSGKTHPLIAAASLGAEILEFHVTFDKQMFGPDSSSSLTISQVASMVNAIRDIEADFNQYQCKSLPEGSVTIKSIFEKSLAVNKNLTAGDTIRFEDLEAKKPKGHGISAKDFENVIGKTLKVSKSAFSFLTEGDIL